jgi:hypothetical protein
MEGRAITGTISIPEGLRLSDLLNDRATRQQPFLTLKDVTIKLIDSIQMVTTLESDSRGIGANDGPKPYPFTQKRPVRATIQLTGFELSGYLYCAETKGITDLFTEEQSFIPCTDTMIYDVNRDSRWKADFAAINKNHVSCFKENDLLP